MRDEDVDSAREALVKAELWTLVESIMAPFDLEDVITLVRTPQRLVMTRFAIWAYAYDIRDGEGRRVYSLSELGRLFNRDHTSIMYGIRRYHESIGYTDSRAEVP